MDSRPGWWPTAIVVVCVALELVLASAPIEATVAISRPLLITAIVGLAIIAVAVSVTWAMGLRREAFGFRVVAFVPVLLSVTLVVVLILEAKFHAPGSAGAGAAAGGVGMGAGG